MTEIFASRKTWLIHAVGLLPGDIVTIHPLDGLTARMIVDAMRAQKILGLKPGYRIVDHGTKIFIQRDMPFGGLS